MHASLLHKWHVFELSSTFISHHRKFAVALLFLTSIIVVSTLAERREFSAVQVERTAPPLSASRTVPLTRLTNVPFEKDFFTRTSVIAESLGALLETLPATRAYLAVYEEVPKENDLDRETQVGFLFEMDRSVSGLDFGPVQGISRRSWLNIDRPSPAMKFAPADSLHNYGLELYNENGHAIAYLGLRLPESASALRDEELAQIQQTAASLKLVLLEPFDTAELP